MKKFKGTKMIIESYYFFALILALVLLFGGLATKFSPLVMFAGVLFMLIGMLGFSGIDREVDFEILRNEDDQNRVRRVDVSTETLIGSPSQETPPPNTKYDIGLWYLSWFFIIGGLFTTVASFIVTGKLVSNLMEERRR